MRKQFSQTVYEVAKEDPKLVAMVGDISHGIFGDMRRDFPERYLNVGVCEPTMMGIAAGFAMVGLRPVVHTIAPFLIERSYEQIKLDFCYQELGASIVSVGSAFDYGDLGCSHHTYGDYGILKLLPGMEIVYPASPKEFDRLFRQTYDDGKPTYFRLPGTTHGIEFADEAIRFGQAIKVREGTDLTIVALGPQLRSAIGAADALASRGVSTEILYPHTIRPLDTDTISESARKTGKVLVVEEHSAAGGVGADVAMLLSGQGIPVDRFGIPDSFIHEYGTYEDHCDQLGFTAAGVEKRALALLGITA